MGEDASLRSQIWMTGVWSSSEARQSCVATSGCHAPTLVRMREAESSLEALHQSCAGLVVAHMGHRCMRGDLCANADHAMPPANIM